MYLCFPVFLMLLLSTTLVAFQYFSSFAVFSSGGACAGTPEDEHNDRPSCSIHTLQYFSSCFLVFLPKLVYDEESDHSNKAVRKTPEIESGHKVSEEVK